MTQKELAEKVGTRRQYINAIVTGRRRPGGQMAVKIAIATKSPVMTWLTGTTTAKGRALKEAEDI